MSKATNIHPTFHRILKRDDKEDMLNQKAKIIWMTGLSGSGKTTIAIGLEQELYKHGYLTQVLDGDNVRTGINNNLGFSVDERTENIRRIAEVSKLFLNCGIITINCFVSPMRNMRQMAKDIIGSDDFLEVYINTPLEVCEKRDVKGLYKKAREGKIKDFTGIDAPFEAPENADIEIKTADISVEQAVDQLLKKILDYVKH